MVQEGGGDEKKELFWGKLNECLGSFRKEGRLVVLGDLNARVGNESVLGETGKNRVPGRNETGSRSSCMRPRSDPPNFGQIERGEKQTNNID